MSIVSLVIAPTLAIIHADKIKVQRAEKLKMLNDLNNESNTKINNNKTFTISADKFAKN